MKKILLLTFLFVLISGSVKAQKDTIPPTILITQSDTNCIEIGSLFVLQDPVVSDNQSRTIDIMVKKSWEQPNGAINTLIRGVYVAKFEATDTNGNKAIKYLTLRVDDCIPPVIDLQTSDTVCVKWRTPYTRVQPKVSDNYYPSNQVSLTLKMSDVDPNIIGYYTDVYEAIDASGNKTTKIRIVKVSTDCSQSASMIDLQKLQWSVFPNPANDFIAVDFMNSIAVEPMRLSVISFDGKQIFTSSISGNFKLDVSQFANGIYTLQLISAGESINKVFVVQH